MFVIIGCCDVASSTRRAANIRRLPTYEQHMTTGMLFPRSLPNAVVEANDDLRSCRLAEDYLNVNLLCGPGITASLVDNNLKLWDITITTEAMSCKVTVKFTDSSKELLKLKVGTEKPGVKLLQKTVRDEFVKSDEMFTFVHVIFLLLLLSSTSS